MKTATWPPFRFFSGALGLVLGFGPRFRAICHVMLGFRLFRVSLNWCLTLIAFNKKGILQAQWNANRNETFWPGENNLHHHKARVYETICFFDRSQSLISRSYYSGLSLACLVMRDDVLLFIHSWDKMSYSVHEHDFESPRVLDVNRGNSHTS